MPTDTVSIEEFVKANRITLTSEYADHNPHMDDSQNMDNYKCMLRRGNARMTLYFSKGIGHHGTEPTAKEILDCLASDAAGIENSRSCDEWCLEYGYNTDSRKAEKTFKACEHLTKRLRTFLGEDLYQKLLWHTEKM